MIRLDEDERIRKMAALFDVYAHLEIISPEMTFERFLKWAEAREWEIVNQQA